MSSVATRTMLNETRCRLIDDIAVQGQQRQNICITFVQRRPNVFDVGSTLYKCYTNLLCLLGGVLFMTVTKRAAISTQLMSSKLAHSAISQLAFVSGFRGVAAQLVRYHPIECKAFT